MKRIVMPCLILALFFLVASVGIARPPQAPPVVVQKPKQAPPKDCGCGGVDLPCECGANCTCSAAKSPGPLEWAIYAVQYNKAVRQNKPLLIWVGETCPACESQWTGWVHARLSEYDPVRGTPYKGPGVIVAKPDGLGGMTRVSTLSGIPTKAAVEALLSPAPAPQSAAPSYRPAMVILPMPMMPMGGFGGGFGGGGCGGGG